MRPTNPSIQPSLFRVWTHCTSEHLPPPTPIFTSLRVCLHTPPPSFCGFITNFQGSLMAISAAFSPSGVCAWRQHSHIHSHTDADQETRDCDSYLTNCTHQIQSVQACKHSTHSPHNICICYEPFGSIRNGSGALVWLHTN